MMSATLAALIARWRHYRPSPAERRAQLISFAYGNAHLSDPRVTREIVEEQAAIVDEETDR
jgi:hypothetical protein